MRQVFFDLPLGNAQHLRQLMGGESSAGQEINNPLARGAFGRRHEVMVGNSPSKAKLGRGRDKPPCAAAESLTG